MSLMAAAGSGRESDSKQEKLVWALRRGINVRGACKRCRRFVWAGGGGGGKV